MIASLIFPGLAATFVVAQAASSSPPPADDLARQLDSILAAPATTSPPPKSPAPTGTALMNPNISVIFDGVAGAASRPRASSAADDPRFAGPMGKRTGGFAMQEIELGFQSIVDPYFAANVFLTIPNLEGIEVEEAYGMTTSLPAGLQVKAGMFRSAAGRQNEQHLHTQDFTLRPLVNQTYLGMDGLRSPGVQMSWLLPLPFFMRLSGEALSVEQGENPTFGGSLPSSPTWLSNLKIFVPFTESWSLFVGATAATGHAPPAGRSPETGISANGPRTLLSGGDLYLKWKPPNTQAGYFALSLQAEYFWRRTWAADDNPRANDGGFYTQLVAQLARRWHVGARFDQLGVPQSTRIPKGARMSAMVMFTPSEFSRVRLQGQREKVDRGAPIYEALLLLEFSIGAHGAHPF